MTLPAALRTRARASDDTCAMIRHRVRAAGPRPCHSERGRRDATTAGGRYLQGYLDCLYQDEAGRWFVVDYKTNHVSARTLPKLVAAYEMQMFAYGLAAEAALGEPVAGLVLHFLRTGVEHAFAWDQGARLRAADLLGRAIEAQCRAGSHWAANDGTANDAAAPANTAEIDLELIG